MADGHNPDTKEGAPAPSARDKRSRVRVRFTDTQLRTLPPGTYTDPGQQGLQLRVRARGAGITRAWLLRIVFKGTETRLALGNFPGVTLADAREEARELRAHADKGIDPRSARRRGRRPVVTPTTITGASSPHSIETLCSEFMARFIEPRRKRPEAVRYMLDRDVLSVWAGRDARTIKPRDVIELLDGIVDRGSPVQANRVAAILSQLFRFGIHRTIVESSPVQLLYKPGGRETPRERVLSEDELRALLRDPQDCTRFQKMAHVLLVLLLTGQRRGELAAAKWVNVNFSKKTWTIPPEDSKTGKGHVVPLSEWAVAEFQALHRERDGSAFVLPGADGQAHEPKLLTRALARCRARMKARGIGAFTLHDLRRTCRTGLARLGVQPHIAERVVNHAQEGMAAVYDVHDYLQEKRDALEKWAAALEGLQRE